MSELQYEPMEHMEKLQWMLDTNGWGIEPVKPITGDSPRAGYSYTFGLKSLIGYPDLAIFGLAPAAARGLLDLIITHLRSGGELPVGQPFNGLLDNDLVSVLLDVELPRHAALFPTLPLIYKNNEWQVRQFIWPDRSGALPWDDTWPEALRFAQPILTSF